MFSFVSKVYNNCNNVSQASAYEKQGLATIARLVTTFRGYRCVKICMPPTREACGGVRLLFLLEHHSFLSFTMKCTNYNYIEIKTGLRGILERVPPRKNTSKGSPNVFYVRITISQSSRWFKASLERFSRMKYCF